MKCFLGVTFSNLGKRSWRSEVALIGTKLRPPRGCVVNDTTTATCKTQVRLPPSLPSLLVRCFSWCQRLPKLKKRITRLCAAGQTQGWRSGIPRYVVWDNLQRYVGTGQEHVIEYLFACSVMVCCILDIGS